MECVWELDTPLDILLPLYMDARVTQPGLNPWKNSLSQFLHYQVVKTSQVINILVLCLALMHLSVSGLNAPISVSGHNNNSENIVGF